jgi:hypothetical protein
VDPSTFRGAFHDRMTRARVKPRESRYADPVNGVTNTGWPGTEVSALGREPTGSVLVLVSCREKSPTVTVLVSSVSNSTYWVRSVQVPSPAR